MTALRELAELRECRECLAKAVNAVNGPLLTDKNNEQAGWVAVSFLQSHGAQLLAILDAEGDGGAVAWMTHHDEPMIFPTREGAASHCDDDEEPIPLYTRPARSGVVSDEDVRDAARYRWLRSREGISYLQISESAIDAAIQGERHE